ncbi:Elongation factor Ts [Porphyridium purpureum]|uniref:Elongation factor Ts, mitochondrial n=1 Tax=Porphyridium purpureum TaxID=35688 RepID=A0A5J4YWN5_PORPP|nr:Elongation factor Ts [Porphyridium purpureum]|eukprot:POR0575..scf209_3
MSAWAMRATRAWSSVRSGAAALGSRRFAVDVEQIKKLRDRTGAPIMQVKRALQEADGDVERALRQLHKMGAAQAAKKKMRTTAQGLVAALVSPPTAALQSNGGHASQTAVLAELRCETDFVARTKQFRDLIKAVLFSAQKLVDAGIMTQRAVTGPEFLEMDGSQQPAEAPPLSEQIEVATGVLGEKLELRRVGLLVPPKPEDQKAVSLFSYVHGAVTEGHEAGRVATVIALEHGPSADPLALASAGRKFAMHVTAANPICVHPDELTDEDVKKGREYLRTVRGMSGEVLEDHLEQWKLDSVLNTQEFIGPHDTKMDDGSTVNVAAVLIDTSIDVNSFPVALRVTNFLRYEIQ